MPETQPVDPADTGTASDADRDARVEQLLLSGLDQYFAGKYEQAINVWTRVAFLERGHGRARAYIERARGAQAERQRECEELLHRGAAAYQSGDMDEARSLLTRAIEEGGPTDMALAFLQRLNRFEAAADATKRAEPRVRTRGDAELSAAPTRWLPTILVSAAAAALILLSALPIASWIAELPMATPAVDAVRPEPLPVVRTSEMQLARARALYTAGQGGEALRVLDRIGRTDPLRAEVDQLRARIQHDVLVAAGVGLDELKGPGR
jgi:tetratricopeptide (TPR) repeat protein